MPAPTKELIKANIKAQLLSKGFYKRDFDAKNNNVVEHPDQLQDQLEEITDAIAEGIFTTWSTWQATQTVTGTTGAGVPVTGFLP